MSFLKIAIILWIVNPFQKRLNTLNIKLGLNTYLTILGSCGITSSADTDLKTSSGLEPKSIFPFKEYLPPGFSSREFVNVDVEVLVCSCLLLREMLFPSALACNNTHNVHHNWF